MKQGAAALGKGQIQFTAELTICRTVGFSHNVCPTFSDFLRFFIKGTVLFRTELVNGVGAGLVRAAVKVRKWCRSFGTAPLLKESGPVSFDVNILLQ